MSNSVGRVSSFIEMKWNDEYRDNIFPNDYHKFEK